MHNITNLLPIHIHHLHFLYNTLTVWISTWFTYEYLYKKVIYYVMIMTVVKISVTPTHGQSMT